MKLKVRQSGLNGTIEIPASKSHTIRAVVLASLAGGTSEILNPLDSADAISARDACRALGADIEENKSWKVRGFAGVPRPSQNRIDVGNSGTTLRIVASVAALGDREIIFDGDESIRKRPMQPLINSLNDLGAAARSIRGNGSCPISVRGRMAGGVTTVDGITSQYLSSLLISCPLAENDTHIAVRDLHEKPYVGMTLRWLDRQGIRYENRAFSEFHVYGNQEYKGFKERVPADFSSATFPLCAAAITDSDITLKGLDMDDAQGDKAVIGMLRSMGADITETARGIRVKGGELTGTELDLNDTPDALPALAVVGTFAKGKTILKNVSHARIKETDRIAAMASELARMGADIKERPDGLIIKKSSLTGCSVHGYSDHRIVMALSLAGMMAGGITEIDTADSVGVTYPGYIKDMASLGAGFSQ
ncbi:MAG: 3-phosphoshikimate 1-carboxyvinyltransferase [archaeon]